MSDQLFIPSAALQQLRMLKIGSHYDAAVKLDGRDYVMRGIGSVGGVTLLYPLPKPRYRRWKDQGQDPWIAEEPTTQPTGAPMSLDEIDPPDEAS